MTYRVRKVGVEDEARWLLLFRAYIAFYDADVPDNVIGLTWNRVLNELDGLSGLVAVDGGDQPVGIATMVFHRSTWSPTYYCYLEDLYVDADVRGAGVGRMLIEAVYAEADRQQATRTYWATKADNHQARRLYDTLARCENFVQYRR